MSEHAEAVIKAVRQLRLKDWDWDGSGGLPMRLDASDTVLAVYDKGGAADSADCPAPSVSLNTNGTIEVSYSDPETGRELFLTFQCNAVITYIRMFEDEQTSIEGTIRFTWDLAANNAALGSLFEWLIEE